MDKTYVLTHTCDCCGAKMEALFEIVLPPNDDGTQIIWSKSGFAMVAHANEECEKRTWVCTKCTPGFLERVVRKQEEDMRKCYQQVGVFRKERFE